MRRISLLLILLAMPAHATDGWIDCCKGGGHGPDIKAYLPTFGPPSVIRVDYRVPSVAGRQLRDYVAGLCHSGHLEYITSVVSEELAPTHEIELWGPPLDCSTWWWSSDNERLSAPLDEFGTILHVEYKLLDWGWARFQAGSSRDSVFIPDTWVAVEKMSWGRIKAMYR